MLLCDLCVDNIQNNIMKKKLLLGLLLIATIMVSAQRIPLQFNNDGKFKIIQITDTHFISGSSKSDAVPALLNEVIEIEKPDLIVFTGDMVWKNSNTQKALDELFAPVIQHKVPWAYVFGNHDDESDMSRKDLMDYVTKMPYCVAKHGEAYLSGVGNYVLEVNKKDGKTLGTVLYCMDSHAYSTVKGIDGYGWFAADQIDWYRKMSMTYTQKNENTPCNALAFFHIPLYEYAEMKATNKNALIGSKDEKECNGKLNSGMFAAMRMSGDVMGTFVGHDHNNDYIGNWHDIYLAYGRFSGGKTVYNDLGKNGCRVIELFEGERVFTTYIRLLGGETLHKVYYPTTFEKKDSK